MKHVALSGLARSGKDTVARLLAEHAGYTRLGFADKLKEAALEVNPIVGTDDDWATPGERLSDVVDYWGWEVAKDRVPEVRRFLQEFGQTMRDLDPMIWVRPVRTQLMNGTVWNMPCAVADARYENEADAIRAQGGLLVRVERPGAGLTGDAANHRSETEMGRVEPDIIVSNGGTLEDLEGIVLRDLIPALEG